MTISDGVRVVDHIVWCCRTEILGVQYGRFNFRALCFQLVLIAGRLLGL